MKDPITEQLLEEIMSGRLVLTQRVPLMLGERKFVSTTFEHVEPDPCPAHWTDKNGKPTKTPEDGPQHGLTCFRYTEEKCPCPWHSVAVMEYQDTSHQHAEVMLRVALDAKIPSVSDAEGNLEYLFRPWTIDESRYIITGEYPENWPKVDEDQTQPFTGFTVERNLPVGDLRKDPIKAANRWSDLMEEVMSGKMTREEAYEIAEREGI